MTEPFNVRVVHAAKLARIAVAGEVDLAAIGALQAARAEALADQPAAVEVDLRDVSFIDSSGLKFLLETHRMAQQAGWELSLVRPRESAMHAFRLTGTDLRLPFVEL